MLELSEAFVFWGDFAWGSFSEPRGGGTEKIAVFWLARGDQYPGWYCGSPLAL